MAYRIARSQTISETPGREQETSMSSHRLIQLVFVNECSFLTALNEALAERYRRELGQVQVCAATMRTSKL